MRPLIVLSKWIVPSGVFIYGVYGLSFRSNDVIWGMSGGTFYSLGVIVAALVLALNLMEGK